MADRFIVPPFTILDTRQGYWQDRKRQWKNLGIDSGKGRLENINGVSDTPDFFKTGYEKVAPGTSLFDPVLCEICYKWFNVDNGVIYDPFAGGSVRGIVAEKLGYKYQGIDLRPEQIDANYKNAEQIGVSPKWYCDDSLNADKYIDDLSCDMIFSCPPYLDLERYSDNPSDLSNMSHEQFWETYKKIIDVACKKLKDNRFAIFVVGDIRDKNGAYVNFIDHTKKCFNNNGLITYNEAILIEQFGTGAMRVNQTFTKSRKLVKAHQNILIFFKGDTKTIRDNYKEIEVDIDE